MKAVRPRHGAPRACVTQCDQDMARRDSWSSMQGPSQQHVNTTYNRVSWDSLKKLRLHSRHNGKPLEQACQTRDQRAVCLFEPVGHEFDILALEVLRPQRHDLIYQC